jgi:hypothetical protein
MTSQEPVSARLGACAREKFDISQKLLHKPRPPPNIPQKTAHPPPHPPPQYETRQ